MIFDCEGIDSNWLNKHQRIVTRCFARVTMTGRIGRLNDTYRSLLGFFKVLNGGRVEVCILCILFGLLQTALTPAVLEARAMPLWGHDDSPLPVPQQVLVVFCSNMFSHVLTSLTEPKWHTFHCLAECACCAMSSFVQLAIEMTRCFIGLMTIFDKPVS